MFGVDGNLVEIENTKRILVSVKDSHANQIRGRRQ